MTDKPDRDTLDIDALIEQCRSGDTMAQIHALIALQDADARRAVDVILLLLDAEDEGVRDNAVEALGYLGEDRAEQVGPAIEARLADPSILVRNDAAEALGLLRYAHARSALERSLGHDEEWVVRCSAAEALGYLGDVRAIDALAAALTDEYEPVRSYAARAIGLLGDESHASIIRGRLAVETEPGLRGVLLAAVARLGDDTVLGELMTMAEDATGELIADLHGTVVDLIKHPHHSMIATRVAELARTARNPHLKKRLAELVRAGGASE